MTGWREMRKRAAEHAFRVPSLILPITSLPRVLARFSIRHFNYITVLCWHYILWKRRKKTRNCYQFVWSIDNWGVYQTIRTNLSSQNAVEINYFKSGFTGCRLSDSLGNGWIQEGAEVGGRKKCKMSRYLFPRTEEKSRYLNEINWFFSWNPFLFLLNFSFFNSLDPKCEIEWRKATLIIGFYVNMFHF